MTLNNGLSGVIKNQTLFIIVVQQSKFHLICSTVNKELNITILSRGTLVQKIKRVIDYSARLKHSMFGTFLMAMFPSNSLLSLNILNFLIFP